MLWPKNSPRRIGAFYTTIKNFLWTAEENDIVFGSKTSTYLYLHVNNFCHARSAFGQLYLTVHQRVKYLKEPLCINEICLK